MFRTTCCDLARGQFKTRLKTRLVGYVPKVVPRKVKGCMVAMRSEANTGNFFVHFKSEAQRMDQTGKKLQMIHYDPSVQRYVVHKETKVKGPFLTKANIQKKL
jgi:ribosomal protein L33